MSIIKRQMEDLLYNGQKPRFKLVMIGNKLYTAPIKGILDRVSEINNKQTNEEVSKK